MRSIPPSDWTRYCTTLHNIRPNVESVDLKPHCVQFLLLQTKFTLCNKCLPNFCSQAKCCFLLCSLPVLFYYSLHPSVSPPALITFTQPYSSSSAVWPVFWATALYVVVFFVLNTPPPFNISTLASTFILLVYFPPLRPQAHSWFCLSVCWFTV